MVNFGATFLLKAISYCPRPDGSGNDGCPSGHTSTAFVGAGYLCLKGNALACGIGLAGASGVGLLRIDAGKHSKDQVFQGIALGFMNGTLFPKFVFKF